MLILARKADGLRSSVAVTALRTASSFSGVLLHPTQLQSWQKVREAKHSQYLPDPRGGMSTPSDGAAEAGCWGTYSFKHLEFLQLQRFFFRFFLSSSPPPPPPPLPLFPSTLECIRDTVRSLAHQQLQHKREEGEPAKLLGKRTSVRLACHLRWT
jgi:hypothetical protein